MSSGHLSFQVTSKYIALYAKLIEGLSPHQIAPRESYEQFFTNLFNLEVKAGYLRDQLNRMPKDACLGKHKPFLNMLFRECLVHARSAPYDDIRKAHALETLSIVLRCILNKNPSGWEVMEILGGGVSQSDDIFIQFADLINFIIGDELAPANIQHQGAQVALIYMCAIGQLSPGAYLLRRDLFPAITGSIKRFSDARFAAESSLLLAVLANFHKSDAAKLNPYLKCIRNTQDKDLMLKICWAINSELITSIKKYKDTSDDSLRSPLATTLGSVFNSLRPDRALSITTAEPPRELFKNQPGAEAVFLLPIFELLRGNTLFPIVVLENTSPGKVKTGSAPQLLHTILTLSSYILAHASSTYSPRSLSYANLSLHVLLALVENDGVMNALTQPCLLDVPLCRQRLPYLPPPRSKRPMLCALLDCCVLWLRHNLHKRLEVYCYLTCIHICYRVVWYLQNGRSRIEYEWRELWDALVGLLTFLATKLDSLDTTGGVEQIVRETTMLLHLSLTKSDGYLPSAKAFHEFIYELIRSGPTLKNQQTLLISLTIEPKAGSRQATWIKRSTEALASITEMIGFYEGKVSAAGARTAQAAMDVVAGEIEVNGLHMERAVEAQIP